MHSSKSLLRFCLLLASGACLFPAGILAAPSPEAEAQPEPLPEPVPQPVPQPQDMGRKYNYEDIAKPTTQAPSEADEVVYANMVSTPGSSSPILKAEFQYFNDIFRQAAVKVQFKKEDKEKCIQWVARAPNPVTGKPIEFNSGSNKMMYATKIDFDQSNRILDGSGNAWARTVGFYSDRYCRVMIGVQAIGGADAASGVLERPAVFSLQQADGGRDQGRASLYLQTLKLPPLFYTLIMG
ncbi:hypothetical protein Dda_6638 [Drechslerella dactyloides]|uniref:Uncharacterized protein n=1 Tax=Drechslerella dactyloides TaxID=74499 RepID=A0AAD6NHQ7_DREDA|nr:hypothetical protein Dda_6638 [Drechslerella dactyloides]